MTSTAPDQHSALPTAATPPENPAAHRQDLREELRAQLAAQVDQLDQAAEHVASLGQVERPRIARRLARRLRACSDRACVVLDDTASSIDQLADACHAASRLQLECSAFLVRDGLRRVLPAAQFAQVDDSAVLVGELAKAAFGDYVERLRREFTGRRRIEFDMNPLHAFAPVIAAGHAWARRTLTAGDVDRHELEQALRTGIVHVFERSRRPNMMVTPTTQMTSDALHCFFVQWAARQDEQRMHAFDEACDHAVAALDGCGIEPDLLGVWFGIGVASGVLRLRLDSAGADRLDSGDATQLLLALEGAPGPCDTPRLRPV